MSTLFTTHEIVGALQKRVRNLEGARRPSAESVSSGCAALDRLLPRRGFARGTLVEWLAAEGAPAATLALIAAREACREGGACVVIDREGRFYPPALSPLRIDLDQTIFARPRNQKDFLWALNQSLACPGVGAVVCRPAKLDDRAFRQLQLAAEKGGALGLFLRPVDVRGQPTWSETQLLVEALPQCSPHARVPGAPGFTRSVKTTLKRTDFRRLRIELLRSRGGHGGATIELELNDETGALQESRFVPVVAPLATATSGQRSSGA